MVSAAYGQGSRMRSMLPPTSHFQKCFSIISNLFHSKKPYAVSTHRKVRTKCIIFGEALRIKAKKFAESLRENYSKSTKIAITACTFSKIFRGSMPPDPPRAFSLSQSELERGPNLPRRDIIASRPRRDIIASRPKRDFKVTRHETS